MINTVKITSKPLQSIILIKLLNGVEQRELNSKLTSFVDSLTTHTNIVEFYKLIINELIVGSDEVIEKWKKDKDLDKDDWEQVNFNLYEYLYKCIIKIYHSTQLEAICLQLNNNKYISLYGDDIGFVEGVGPVLKSANPELFEDEPKSRKVKSMTAKGIDSLRDRMKASIIGQDKAIDKVVSFVKLKEVGFIQFFSLLLIGKSGTGKTKTARVLAENYTQGRIITIDCSLATEGHEKSVFLGAPPGYAGHTGTSFLAEKAKISDNWVILLDEIEKANDKTLDNILNFIDTGIITDNNGNQLDFTKSMFILTSNQGIEYIKKGSRIGWNKNNTLELQSDQEVITGLEKRFKKEFLNRIDEIIVVNDLNKDNAKEIAKLELAPYPVQINDSLLDYIVSGSFSEEYGARNIKRFVKSSIGVPLAETILNDGSRKKKIYKPSILDSKVVFSLSTETSLHSHYTPCTRP